MYDLVQMSKYYGFFVQHNTYIYNNTNTNTNTNRKILPTAVL